MNILTEELPKGVEVGNTFFYLNTDFRAGVEFELMAEKGENNVYKLLRPYFPSGIPLDISGALEAVLRFYACGNLPEKTEGKSGQRLYSFAVDAETICADFRQYYNIDLSAERLHWFTFRALLMGLPEESGFKKRVYYRTCDLKGLPKKERERIIKIRAQIKIDKPAGGKMTLEERNAQMREYVNKRSKEANKGGGLNG